MSTVYSWMMGRNPPYLHQSSPERSDTFSVRDILWTKSSIEAVMNDLSIPLFAIAISPRFETRDNGSHERTRDKKRLAL
jgi:hypothetical protein